MGGDLICLAVELPLCIRPLRLELEPERGQPAKQVAPRGPGVTMVVGSNLDRPYDCFTTRSTETIRNKVLRLGKQCNELMHEARVVSVSLTHTRTHTLTSHRVTYIHTHAGPDANMHTCHVYTSQTNIKASGNTCWVGLSEHTHSVTLAGIESYIDPRSRILLFNLPFCQ